MSELQKWVRDHLGERPESIFYLFFSILQTLISFSISKTLIFFLPFCVKNTIHTSIQPVNNCESLACIGSTECKDQGPLRYTTHCMVIYPPLGVDKKNNLLWCVKFYKVCFQPVLKKSTPFQN